MTNFIPIFPLGIVVYPGEALNLHIFEPRYKQLIAECYTTKKPFGIPPVIQNKVQDFGSLVEITELAKTYDNGEMDIKTRGVRIFRILEMIKGPMEMTVFAKREEWRPMLDLLKLYQAQNKNIKLKAIDTDVRPDLVKAKGIDQNGTVLINYKGQETSFVIKGLNLAINSC